MSVVSVVCCRVERSLLGADHSSRAVLLRVVCVSVIVSLVDEEALAH
jgi:hypothetical protein